MSLLEKKQRLLEKVQTLPDRYVDEVDNLLDAMLLADQQRKERFEQLLAQTSETYKAVWKALA